ncbi:hypothetical protein GXN76_00950 [Kroppenstedtia pulmonis]|uniref:Uncharacterized protein n=1 Tax=Kroppenstedtia pulmonis TaxID=1380685 RepID=A0A7D3XNP0_9BACL|nr:hypothetical protein [Kroppenstedtia pulmonis]QKG83167.1 hypothetical protein GXN76_00950 [Kroppenstedtia pulmonis]
MNMFIPIKEVKKIQEKEEAEKLNKKASEQAKREAESARWYSLDHKGKMPKDGRVAKHIPGGVQKEGNKYIQYTKNNNPALYHPELSDPKGNFKKLEEFERRAWETGIEVDMGEKGAGVK